ncbi:interferon regulatory factor 3 isoform X1 [Gopherus flavomarginatus]|uniref:interferon regulatory factor 3 isoform X1 n=1 Tax=Gopherus flavomarginatus TaxID=286002 RepID=UPI0021CBE741|nr:interferon regulatory factor 3 isoform X1 [Gopherus flavomarginatus]
MGTPKPLIVPWLRRKLDEGCYPGVRWLDQRRTQFRVPWKHGLRQDASTEDFQLFRDWAIDSGSYRPDHDAPAPSVWKRNFRSALNRKPGIQVLRDHSSDSADPHKVYEILPEGGRGGVDKAPSAAVGGTEADASSQLLDKSGGSFSSSQDEELDDILNALALSSPDEDAPGPAGAPGASYASDAATGGALSLGFGDFPPLEPAPSSLEQLLGSNVLMTFFEVRVYYRGHLVLQTLVSNPQGFRLVPPSPGPSPCPELADVVLPEPGMLPDRVQASYTARLLQGLGAGVRLQVEGPALCATRLGRLHAYWGRTETPELGAEGGELSKEGCTPLYDLPRFVRELICFMEGQGSSPTYELWLCLGEAWPDTGRSWKKKLIMVQVVPTALQTLHQLSQAGGASSLRAEELDLRISDSLGEAGLLGALRDWEERMESQPYG